MQLIDLQPEIALQHRDHDIDLRVRLGISGNHDSVHFAVGKELLADGFESGV